MKHHILLVGRSRELHQKVKEKNMKSTLIVEMSKITKEKVAPIYDRVIGMSNKASIAEWVDVAVALHAITPFTCIGGFTETKEEAAVEIAQRLNLPFHDKTLIHLTHEKDELRKFLQDKKLDDTRFCRLPAGSSKDQVQAAVNQLSLPVILKPANARGSLAVRIIKNNSDLESALKDFVELAGNYDFLLEKLLVGQEFSVESFSEKGKHKIICVTEKFKDEVTSIELGHLVPARISEAAERQIRDYVLNMLIALNVQNGPAHTEVFMTAQGPRIVETHTRLGGDRIPDLVRYVAGVDLTALWVDQVAEESVLDKVPQIFSANYQGPWAAVQFSTLSKEGQISKIENVEKALQLSKVKEAHALLSQGDHISVNLVDSFSRSTEAIAMANDPQEAINVAKQAAQTISFEVVESEQK